MQVSFHFLRTTALAIAMASAAVVVHAGWGASQYEYACCGSAILKAASPVAEPGKVATQAPLPAAKASGSRGAGKFVGGWGSSMYQYSTPGSSGSAPDAGTPKTAPAKAK